MRSRRPKLLRLATLAVALPALAAALPAQSPVWVPVLPGAAPGTPATVELVESLSNNRESYVDVRVPGFWQEDVLGADGVTYQRLSVPGLPSQGEPGAPELPVARLALAVPTDADELVLQGVTESNVLFVSNLLPYPEPILAEDGEGFDPSEDPGSGDTLGTDELFVAPDPGIYNAAQFWPAAPGLGPQDVLPMVGPVPGGSTQVHPVTAFPLVKRVRVAGLTRLHFLHDGALLSPPPMTKLQAKLAAAAFLNWPSVEQYLPSEPTVYHARYLIVSPAQWLTTAAPFVEHKQKLGFETTLISNNIADALHIVGLIQSWYAQGDPNEEHYVLLLGDTDLVPQFTLPLSGLPTDDPYGLLTGVYSAGRCYLGRLSGDDATDIAVQLDKIMQYELNPEPGGRYDRALLVAHKEDYPGKYTAAHEKVRTASYSHPPVFLKRYGAENEPNFLVMNDIGNEVGVVAYRGHGSTRTWSDWNTLDQNFHVNEVVDLFNTEVLPVVWSFSCTNSNLNWTSATAPTADSIGEAWLEVPDVGAVAHYGATVSTSTKPNHDLDALFFDLLYDQGVTVHGQLVELAELLLNVIWQGHKNPWAYLLLGDPAMVVRRELPSFPVVLAPGSFSMPDEPGGEFLMPFELSDAGGAALGEAIVSLWKPSGIAGMPPEIQVAHWTDAAGVAAPYVIPSKPGPIFWSARDLEGNITQGVTEVLHGPAWKDLGFALAGEFGVPRLSGVGSLQAGSFAGLYLTNARPNTQTFLCVGLGAISASFKGGVLVPDIFGPGGFFRPWPSDALGGRALEVSWPSGVPSGLEIYFQDWFPDAGGVSGFAATNALRATTP